MKFKFIQGAKAKSQQGFTLLETMTAAMISLVFLSLGANLVLAANLQKVVAKRNISMSNFIQSDLEGIKYQSNLIAKDNTKCSPVDVANGYAGALQAKVGTTVSSTVKILNQNYTMTRSIGTITNPRILPISYTFNRSGSTTSDYQLYIELIPNAAFTCPSS
jgi:prepilin-type N-terminal cleavage/methylation domain-containing protein